MLCRTHIPACRPSPPPHALCTAPVSWLAAWSLAEGLATAERYAVAMAVATDMAVARLLPSPRQPSRSKRRGRGGMSGSRLAQPRVRKLWQCERARRPARGVLRSSTGRPQQLTPAPCPRQLAAALLAAGPRAKPLPSSAHACRCPRQLAPAFALASSRQPPSVASSRQPACPCQELTPDPRLRQRPTTTTGRTKWRNGPCSHAALEP